MPFVKIHLRDGKNHEYVRAVCDGIHTALVAEANVPPDDRFQVVNMYGEGSFFFHPSYGGVSRTNDLVIVEITFNVGRTIDVKKNLYAAIARNLQQDPGVRPDDVLICLSEVQKENWSFGRGIATYAG
jgi:4-oxalocrotonate tautomerase